MRANHEPADTLSMNTLTSPTPENLRGKAWNKYAKDVSWNIIDGEFIFSVPSKSPLEGWSAPIGVSSGEIAKCLHISGRFGVDSGYSILLDHYVFVDAEGKQVGNAIRRSIEGLAPTAGFWGLTEVREFLKENDIPMTYKVFGYAKELNDAFPGILAQCPTLQPKKKLLGFLPV